MSEQTIRVTAATAYVSLGISRSVLFVLYFGVCVSDFVHDYKDLVSHTRYIIVKSSCGGPSSLCGAIMLQLRQSSNTRSLCLLQCMGEWGWCTS